MTITEIIKLASDYSGIEPNQIHIKTRKEEVVIARQLAHYMAKKKTDLSLANIGKLIGNKDHATVLHSINTIENYLQTPNRHQKPLLTFMKKADILTVDIDNIQVMPSLMKVVFSQNTLSSSALKEQRVYFQSVPHAKLFYFLHEKNDEGFYQLSSLILEFDHELRKSELEKIIESVHENKLVLTSEFFWKG